ncbi:DUF4199 domain-containing protein [Flavobacterium sp. RNTU_13]|uniref:DUF4199 domain-containing protein n=1 Tax=Flavobacterium sp. RNTU_13 TaxID=3375145 RepID=UPI003987D81F
MSEFTTKTPVTTTKAASSYGVIFAIIMIAEFVIAYVADIDATENAWVGIVNGLLNNLILPVVFISLAANYYKKAHGGYIKFGEVIKTGVTVAVIAAAIFALFNIGFNLAVPEAQAEMIEKMKAAQIKANPQMTSAQLKMAMSMAETFMKPYIAFPFTILFFAFLGLIYSLIIGAIVKKENPFGDVTPQDVNNIGAE